MAEKEASRGNGNDGADGRLERGQTDHPIGQAPMFLRRGDPRRPHPGNHAVAWPAITHGRRLARAL